MKRLVIVILCLTLLMSGCSTSQTYQVKIDTPSDVVWEASYTDCIYNLQAGNCHLSHLEGTGSKTIDLPNGMGAEGTDHLLSIHVMPLHDVGNTWSRNHAHEECITVTILRNGDILKQENGICYFSTDIFIDLTKEDSPSY